MFARSMQDGKPGHFAQRTRRAFGAALLVVGLSSVATAALAQQADCQAIRDGRPFQLTFSSTINNRETTVIEQHTAGADAQRTWREHAIGVGVTRHHARFGLRTTVELGGGRSLEIEYPGLDLSVDHYAGDRPFAFTMEIRQSNGQSVEVEVRAEPAGTESVTISGCSFATRLWTQEIRPRNTTATSPSRATHAYAPELRVFVRQQTTFLNGAPGRTLVARELTTSFTPAE